MKVRNMTNDKGRAIPNQFILEDEGRGALGNFDKREIFQSYGSIIAIRTVWKNKTRTELDEKYWDYSNTTGKYLNQFLGESIAETRKKIESGEYILCNLNKN